jgi:DNA-binding response OmpR family regulator
MSGGRILVAGDSSAQRRTLAAACDRLGYQVTEASDGAAALAGLRSAPFDIVVLDLRMPILDGLATLAEITADSTLAAVSVIMTCEPDDVAAAAQCIEIGAVDYLVTPFQPALVQARVEATIAARRARDAERIQFARIADLIAAARRVKDGACAAAELDAAACADDPLASLAQVFRDLVAHH